MLEATIIGCGATMPLPNRAVASFALKYNGSVFLVDCGEGTQAAARAAGISLFKIDAIFLTHYHGDHIFGLPGLLQTIGSLGREKPIEIYAPAYGIRSFLQPLLDLAGALPYPVNIIPISGGERIALNEPNFSVESFPMEHRIPSFGYAFSLKRSGKFLPEKALALGVEKINWATLQNGNPVTLENGTVITSAQVMGPPRKGLRVVYAVDTAPCNSVTAAARDADLFICDGTYASDDDIEKARTYGHCTFRQAAEMAQKADVKQLCLTHFGGALTEPESALAEIKSFFPHSEAAYDGKTMALSFDE